jgi:hypothetical protein
MSRSSHFILKSAKMEGLWFEATLDKNLARLNQNTSLGLEVWFK